MRRGVRWCLLQFLDDDDESVRSWAGAHALEFAPERGATLRLLWMRLKCAPVHGMTSGSRSSAWRHSIRTRTLSPQRDVAEFRCSPSAVRTGESVEFRFGDFSPARWAVSGSVGFGIDDGDQLLAVRVSATALPQSSPLAV